ncbi:hypothetical protein MMC09_006209 [Bachmanniomyces sp. S44760]|nr:hypothetical protein [Bachmanniomyces sp. S44760]
MPTPNDDTLQHFVSAPLIGRATHTTCPPDHERFEAWRPHEGRPTGQDGVLNREPIPRDTNSQTVESSNRTASRHNGDAQDKSLDTRERQPSPDGMSPMSSHTDQKENEHAEGLVTTCSGPNPGSSTRSYEFSHIRQYPNHTSSFLRAGSKFKGTQQSDRQEYNVEVDIKHVDMNESFLCGYLRIEGLTEDHPTLTTYFEGEIIGPKYTFQTKHDSWGATDKTDMQHWARFPPWRPLAKSAKKPDFHYKNCTQKENMFMRWKEYFLVPDHRVREIMGASFEGFYYICFNQIQGTVSGIYFHAKSEKYQQLELKHVDDKGCLASVEFR